LPPRPKKHANRSGAQREPLAIKPTEEETMHKRNMRLAGVLLIVALTGAACSSDSTTGAGDTSTTPTQSTSTTVNGADTEAAGLRQVLTSALQQHEYLAGVAIYAAVNTGPTSKVTKAGLAALDENTKDLGAAIGSIYGADAEKAFLPLWRKHIGFFVDYTLAGAKKDKAGQAKAKKDLDGYRADFGAFLASANPNLTKDAVADALVPHVESTFDAIDAVLAKDPGAFDKLKEAAGKLPELGQTLAGAIATQKSLEGDVASPGAGLRQVLTSGLQEHEYLAGIAIFNAVNFGMDAKVTKGAIATLDDNTKDLGAAIGSVYGEDAEKAFLPLWRRHIGFFVEYTLAGANGDKAGQAKAKSDLDGYRADFGAFLASANPNLTKDAVADALIPHVESTFDAIDAVLAKTGQQFLKLKSAADKLPETAMILASAIAKQKNLG
jgi:hypothetical protein